MSTNYRFLCQIEQSKKIRVKQQYSYLHLIKIMCSLKCKLLCCCCIILIKAKLWFTYTAQLRPEGGGGVNVIFSVFTYVTELLKTKK